MSGFHAAGSGARPDGDALQRLTFKISSASALARTVVTSAAVAATGSAANLSAELAAAFQYNESDRVCAYPLRVRDKVLAVVLVDETGKTRLSRRRWKPWLRRRKRGSKPSASARKLRPQLDDHGLQRPYAAPVFQGQGRLAGLQHCFRPRGARAAAFGFGLPAARGDGRQRPLEPGIRATPGTEPQARFREYGAESNCARRVRRPGGRYRERFGVACAGDGRVRKQRLRGRSANLRERDGPRRRDRRLRSLLPRAKPGACRRIRSRAGAVAFLYRRLSGQPLAQAGGGG